MGETKPPRPTRTSTAHRGDSTSALGRLRGFWSAWWPEFLVVLFLAFGVFLLFERLQIRQTLLRWLQKGWSALVGLAEGTQGVLVRFVRQSTLSDLIGLVLLAASVAVVVWRVRWRLLHSARFTERLCPRCGSALQRVHRRGMDRALNLLVPVRRYRCDNRDCRWNGLRFGPGRRP